MRTPIGTAISVCVAAILLNAFPVPSGVRVGLPVAHAQKSQSVEAGVVAETQSFVAYSQQLMEPSLAVVYLFNGEEFTALLPLIDAFDIDNPDSVVALNTALERYSAVTKATLSAADAAVADMPQPPALPMMRASDPATARTLSDLMVELRRDNLSSYEELARGARQTVEGIRQLAAGNAEASLVAFQSQLRALSMAIVMENNSTAALKTAGLLSDDNPRFHQLSLIAANNEATIVEYSLISSELAAPLDETREAMRAREAGFLDRMEAAISGWESDEKKGRESIKGMKRELQRQARRTPDPAIKIFINRGVSVMDSFAESFDIENEMMRQMEKKILTYRTVDDLEARQTALDAIIDEETRLALRRIEIDTARADALQ